MTTANADRAMGQRTEGGAVRRRTPPLPMARAIFVSTPWLFRCIRASGSVVEACVRLLCFSLESSPPDSASQGMTTGLRGRVPSRP